MAYNEYMNSIYLNEILISCQLDVLFQTDSTYL